MNCLAISGLFFTKMYSENKKKFLIFFFKPFSLLAHESFQPKSPEIWLATPDFFPSVRRLAFGPPIF
jgi:hypothetical protein